MRMASPIFGKECGCRSPVLAPSVLLELVSGRLMERDANRAFYKLRDALFLPQRRDLFVEFLDFRLQARLFRPVLGALPLPPHSLAALFECDSHRPQLLGAGIIA